MCQKERHADPILPLLQVSKPASAQRQLLTRVATYEAAIASILEFVGATKVEELWKHPLICEPSYKQDCIRKKDGRNGH